MVVPSFAAAAMAPKEMDQENRNSETKILVKLGALNPLENNNGTHYFK